MIRRLLLAGLLLGTRAAYAPPFAGWDSLECRVGFIVVGPWDITIDELKARYRKVRRETPGLVPSVDGLRFVALTDWVWSQESPHHSYGANTYHQWARAAEYVRSLGADVPITPMLLQKIHALAMEGHYFRGFERRRIEAALRSGALEPGEGKKLLDRLDEGQVVRFTGKDHDELLGAFRADALDEFVHNGDHQLPEGGRYFTATELERYRKNPYLTVDEKTLVDLGQGRFTGTVRYRSPADVRGSVDRIFKDLNERLAKSKDDLERVRAISQFQLELMTVHPFLDGNGRSIRLLADLLYERYGLPPPLHFHGAELEMNTVEASQFTLNKMLAYVVVLERHAKLNRR